MKREAWIHNIEPLEDGTALVHLSPLPVTKEELKAMLAAADYYILELDIKIAGEKPDGNKPN